MQINQQGPIDAAALRRFWPEVIENVKKRRRLNLVAIKF
jgi:hypothetical protein